MSATLPADSPRARARRWITGLIDEAARCDVILPWERRRRHPG